MSKIFTSLLMVMFLISCDKDDQTGFWKRFAAKIIDAWKK